MGPCKAHPIYFSKCQVLESLQDSLRMLRNGILQDSFCMLSFLRLIGLCKDGRLKICNTLAL